MLEEINQFMTNGLIRDSEGFWAKTRRMLRGGIQNRLGFKTKKG